MNKEHNSDINIILLTKREKEVLKEVVMGLNNNEIGDKLIISHHTIKAHISSMLKKLNLKNRITLAVYAVKHEIV